MLTWIDWLMILGYFGVLAGVVVFSLRRNKIESGEDLFLGGRSVGWLAIGASIFAANIGSEHLIGLAGSGAVAGLSQSHWEFHAWVLVMMSWVFLPFYYNSGVSTMPEFLERRFGAKARWILSLVSLAAYVLTKISVTVFAGALFFEVMMPEVQLTIGGTVVSSFWIGAVATVVLAGVYSSIGGLSAVVYTDLVQTGIILLGTLSVTGFALHHNHVVINGAAFAIPLKEGGALNGDTVFPTLVQTLLPVGFRGLVVAGMIAALMSSLASLFNSVSTLFTVDVYQKLKPETSQKKLVVIGRTTTIVMTALGLL